MPTLSQADLRRKRTGATPPRKHSPGRRSPEGQFGLYQVQVDSKRKGFRYKWGYIGSTEAMSEARAMGWLEVKWEFAKIGKAIQRNKSDGRIKVTGPSPLGAAPEESDMGCTIRVGDQVLLEISEQRYADIQEYGACGQTGQAGADIIDHRITDRSRGRDELRGMKGINTGGRHHMSSETWDDGSMQHGDTERL